MLVDLRSGTSASEPAGLSQPPPSAASRNGQPSIPERPTPPLRIAVFTNAYPTVSHTFIRNEIAALERHGLEVVRIAIRPSPVDDLDDADRLEALKTVALLSGSTLGQVRSIVARIWKAPRALLSALRLTLSEPQRLAGRFHALAYLLEACLLADIVEAAQVHHVHVHFGTNPAAIARLATRLSALTFSMTVHGPDEFDAPVPLHLRAKIADARLTVAVSDFGRSQLLRWADVADWPRIQVVRCGVAPAFRTVATPGDGQNRSRTLVCVARLSAQKGIPILFDAAVLLARQESFVLRIIGDGPMRRELAARISAMGLSDHVRLLGWLGPDAVRRELLDARALVLPSFAEGLPIVLMEALALGRPVVATAIAGIPELVDARNGWLVRAGSAKVLAEAMGDALRATPATLADMARVGRARIARGHDVDRNARRLAALLRDAL